MLAGVSATANSKLQIVTYIVYNKCTDDLTTVSSGSGLCQNVVKLNVYFFDKCVRWLWPSIHVNTNQTY